MNNIVSPNWVDVDYFRPRYQMLTDPNAWHNAKKDKKK